MKNSNILRAAGLFLALLCVVSCSKKEGVVNTDDPILGTWQLTDYTLEAEVTIDDDDERTLDVNAKGGEDMGELFITFHPDGTTSYSGVGFTLAYTVSKGGNPIAEDEMRMQSLVLNGTWKREGDKLIVDNPGYGLDPLEIDIASLTENELHLAAAVTPVMDLPESGYTAVTAAADAHFVRTTLTIQHEEEHITDPIVGTWQMVGVMWETTVTVEDGVIFMEARDVHVSDANILVTYHPDGTTTVTGDTFTMRYTMTANGHSSITDIETKQPIQNGTWKRVGNKFIVDSPGTPGNVLGPQEINITVLTDKEMHVFRDTPPPIPVPGQGNIKMGVHYFRVD